MKTIATYFIFLCFLFLSTITICAQGVGVVLSGGGAKGITHIGVIKALEEHNIPIDYIAGTSMGAIVGGMYAIGMTTDEMIELLKSDDFKSWSTGNIDPKYTYYYRLSDPNPGIFEMGFFLNLAKRLDSISIKPALPSNVVSPDQMNFGFLELFMRANAVSGGNFDNLFVPFRSVAADVYKKEAVIFSQGDLGDAIRASMSIPFVFKPIIVDGRLLFDGGIYDNFPLDVMRHDFAPDLIIGSAVFNEAEQPTLDNPFTQLQSLIMSPVPFSIPEDEGLLLRFDLKGQSLFDFSPVDKLVELGYNQTIDQIDEIKQRIGRTVSEEEIAERRANFSAKFPVPTFRNIYMTGIDAYQQQYVSRFFKTKNDGTFDLERMKKGYFELMSDERIKEIIPHAKYDSLSGYFDLHLHVRPETNMLVRIGGNVSSSTSNQAYIGLRFQKLGASARTTNLDAQFGKIYNGMSLGTRIDFATERDLYMRGRFVAHRYDYYEGIRFFYQDNPTSEFSQNETFVQLHMGMPFTQKGRVELGISGGYLSDKYVLDQTLQTHSSTPDRSKYFIAGVSSQIESYTFDKVMYPTKGHYSMISLKGFYGRESFQSSVSSVDNISGKKDLWWQLSGRYEQYHAVAQHFILGTHAEFVLSTRDFSHNYTATIIQAPAFKPTPHSNTVFNEAYSANRFAAVGVKPILQLSNSLSLRNETYLFLPYQSIQRQTDGMAFYSDPFTSYQYMSELSLVLDILKVASISIFTNYYSTAASQWNFGINIGCLLFNKKFLK
ncbi:MAG: patatin-like phospholipase family protein [Dysgonamonadaceae bacterium]|jgi:NTE family protein|nr:patatin-like phospholipase family protein [Dysgonamonadaceae bacterium]